MELDEALMHLINSEDFKEKAKQKNAEGGKYRMFIVRYGNGELKNGGAVDFLIEHGYQIHVMAPKMQKKERKQMIQMEKKFKIGDIVRLKSGGPKMTVIDYKPNIKFGIIIGADDRLFTPTYLKCQWFNGATLMKQTFEQEVLTIND